MSPSLDFAVYCGNCGAGLCDDTDVSQGNRVKVQPCEKCIESAREEGDAAGYQRGLDEGKEAANAA